MFAGFRKSPRLSQWDGRRRSSRCDAVRWSALADRRVLTRLAVVALTAAALTALAAGPAADVARVVAVGTVVGLLTATVGGYTALFQPALARSRKAVARVGGLVVVTLALAVHLDAPPWGAAAVPLTVAAMALTVAYNPPFALFMSLGLAVLFAVARGNDLGPLIVYLGGLTTAVLALRRVRTRTRPVEVGVAAGVALALMTAAADTLAGQPTWDTAADAGRNLLWGVLAGCLVSGGLPLIERAFGVVTDARLLELADGSHPLLQELLRRAPGTYTHSMTVAVLAEPAAEAIGANPLLTRVGAYYHDVGKMLKPHYFAENQAGENAHDQLEPSLSTLVIVGHVKDGVALAEEYGLPGPVADFIRQHHGTTLVEYFFRAAVRMHGPGSGSADHLEAGFRYPGPKPRTKEACVLMLADVAESASRALPTPTPSALKKLVHEQATKRLVDGQFDDSGLTLGELRTVEEVICKGLIALYHARVKYPEAKPA